MVSEFLSVARQVLKQEARPMCPKEIVSLVALRSGLFSDRRAGRTPHLTMKSKLSVNVRRLGTKSGFCPNRPGLLLPLRQLLDGDHREYSRRARSQSHVRQKAFWSLTARGSRNKFASKASGSGPRGCWNDCCGPRCASTCLVWRQSNHITHKQVLTYIMVTRGDSVLAYRRGNYNRVEDFLRGSHCIGFGGHVVQADRTLFTESGMGVYEAAVRELNEELDLPKDDKRRLQQGAGMRLVGLLNDDSSEVGQRHLAVLFSYEVGASAEWDKPTRGEKSITQLRWLAPRELPPPIWEFEYWSQLCLREYFPLPSARARPHFELIAGGHLTSRICCASSARLDAANPKRHACSPMNSATASSTPAGS